MKIYLATDHAGFELKENIKKHLEETGHEVYDCGALTLEPGDGYPEYMARAAENVQKDAMHAPSMAVIFGGSGQGEAIVANRFRHVRDEERERCDGHEEAQRGLPERAGQGPY